MIFYFNNQIKFTVCLVANSVRIERTYLLTEKRQRMIQSHREKLAGNIKKKWDDADLIERRDSDNKFKRNDNRKHEPVGKHEPRIVELLAANPTKEFTSAEIASHLGFIYKSNIYDPLNNLYNKGLIDKFTYSTGTSLWRYKN
jgi:hypothetical protein